MANASQPGWDRPPLDPGVPLPGTTAAGLLAWSDLRTLADLTGGYVSIARSATRAVDEIDAGTRAGYLLAYSPSNASSDGRYRAITVEVNRPGLTVLFRHGYYGSQSAAPLSRSDVVSEGRLTAAAQSTKDLRDIGVSVAPTFTKDRTGGGEILVQMVIDTARLAWTSDDLSRHVTHLEVLVSCGTAGQKTVGQTHRKLNLALTDERFGQVTRQGLPYSVRMPLSAPARYVKVVVYNLESNLVGSALATMK